MANITRTFTAGKMNKVIDQRLLPDGQYVDAMNIRMGSTENSEIGVIENTKGNIPLTALTYTNGTPLSADAVCIGSIEDSKNETIYWFVHDPSFEYGETGKLDLILSYNVYTKILTYHVISINDGDNAKTVLNFNPRYLITGLNIIGDLLFFTDNYNQPRVINTTRKYPTPLSDIDAITAESLLVIKKPPVSSPSVTPFETNGQENYLDTRFVSFAYRYRYIDGEYSATSQWSAPAFSPKPFQFSTESYLNEGMVNSFNAAKIKYNSGSSLVVGVDLLFKDNDGNIIKVIEKLDKSNLGLANDTEYEYTFVNSKIFTILPDTELLRLYDNVPRTAEAQTIMGNRLMYGNYLEGYDLNDKYGNPVKFEYYTDLISSPIGNTTIPDDVLDGDYTINGSVSVNDAIVTIDLSDKDLISGSSISLDVRLAHASFSGETPYPTDTTEDISTSFVFFLNKKYNSVYEMATSEEFQNAVGTIANISPVADACNGITFTDDFNCAVPNQLDNFEKVSSGISALNQPIKIITDPGSSVIGFQFPAMKFVDSTVVPSKTIYEYYSVTFGSALFQEISNPKSLHSNRDYEIGIVYMDEFNRSSTTLVSKNNTEHVPCGKSFFQNKIQVTIPSTQLPPSWATRYKFVIKPSEENYDTVYCNIFFKDPESNNAYFLLEGENAKKVEQGDRFIVKADSAGPTTTCTYATILEKSSQASGFIDVPSQSDPTVLIPVPAGVYAKINPNSFSIVNDDLAIIAPGKKTATGPRGGSAPTLFYPMSVYNTVTDAWEDYTVPAGSKIVLDIHQYRLGVGGSCEERSSILKKTLTSSKTYDNMYDWFVGDNIDQVLKEATVYAGNGQCEPKNTFIPGITSSTAIPTDFCTNYYQFYRDPGTSELFLAITGTDPCTGIGYPNSRASNVEVNITVFRSEKTIIFETEPTPALPDVFYENNLSFPIVDGNHMGNIVDQDIPLGIDAVIDTEFFNCYSFGNGAESYKIRDSIVGHYFNLGNRVNSVSAQDYQAYVRFADITYSGVYNAETNVNKLNVFNLGLANFKNLETSFGPIYILDGRQTDVLVLQEDKISYVLADKNLLSDSAGGSAVTSVPEVLGTQIARTEKYGISFNPESYVQWGYDRYFTDVKRGAVIQLRGDSYSQDQLQVVSEFDMRTWFRDLFNTSFATQKIGGYDPYMNEYILSSNDRLLPKEEGCLACGIKQTFTLSSDSLDTVSYCVDLGPTVGTANIVYSINSISEDGQVRIVANYNGTEYDSGWISEGGTLAIDKDSISIESVSITISYIGNISLDVLADCCNADMLTIVQVVLTNNYESGDTIHAEYRYVKDDYTSPLQSNFVSFSDATTNPLVSFYNVSADFVGTGGFPPAGSTVRLISNRYQTDTFVFDSATDKFRYATSNTLYNNTPSDITSLIGISTEVTPNLGGGDYNYAEFTAPTLSNYLYLIWDFRTPTSVDLCYSNTSADDSCSCSEEPAP